MKFEKTIEYFYQKCSQRVSNRVEQSNLKHKDIYTSDPKQISRIINNRKTSNNRFLVCDSVLENYIKNEENGTYSPIGLIPKLGFIDKKEVLWGTDEELEDSLETIFFNIIYDLLDSNVDYGMDIEYILCDYVPYAYNSTYFKIITSKDNFYPAIYYGVKEDVIIGSNKQMRERAIQFLFLKCKEDFRKKLLFFTSTVSSYKKIDSVFESIFIIAEFIPMLKVFLPNESSLGLRVKNLIIADLSKSAEMIAKAHLQPNDKFSCIRKSLNNASSTYILELEKIQEQYIELLKQE